MNNDPTDTPQRAAFAAAPSAPTGQPGDFDFLGGNWKIKNRQLQNGVWDAFEGEATVYGMLAGIAGVEDSRIPVRGFSGMGLRLLDVERKLWADYWVNSKSGVLTQPAWGGFVDGVGVWDSDDKVGELSVIVRGIWDEITAASCRWRQAVSRDGGTSWQKNWVMRWARA
jgi:hypothetical protein